MALDNFLTEFSADSVDYLIADAANRIDDAQTIEAVVKALDAVYPNHVRYDWSRISTVTYPYGWQTGYWDSSGQKQSALTNACCVGRPNTASGSNYGITGAKFCVLRWPKEYKMIVRVYDPASPTTQLKMYSFNLGVAIFPAEGQIGFSLIHTEGDQSENVVDADWVAQITLDFYFADAGIITAGDGVEAILDTLPHEIYDWSKAGTVANPNGWRVGYWDDNGSVYADSAYISANTRFNPGAESNWAHTGKFFCFRWPNYYTLDVAIYSPNSDTTLVSRTKYAGGVAVIPITSSMGKVGLTLCGFGSAAGQTASQAIADTDFLATIQAGVYFAPQSSTYLRRTDEFTRFEVTINKAWPQEWDQSADNDEPVTSANIKCIIALPTTYSPGGDPTPLIMFGHGYNSYITDTKWYPHANGDDNADFLSMIRFFTAAGYAVFDVDNSGQNHQTGNDAGWPDWGSLPLMSSYLKAWEYIKDNYNVEKKLYILSDSMGTAAALNMMKWYPSEVITAIMLAPRPVCQERYETYVSRGDTTIAANMRTAFGFGQSETTWPNRLKPFNHYESLVEIGSTDYVLHQFPPCKVLVGGADTTLLTEVRAYYNALRAAGNYVNYREVSGEDHGDISFLTYKNSSDEYPLREECLAWFQRFK